jgi:septal ring factor EnvC (AmiA/AmiB activator)
MTQKLEFDEQIKEIQKQAMIPWYVKDIQAKAQTIAEIEKEKQILQIDLGRQDSEIARLREALVKYQHSISHDGVALDISIADQALKGGG